LASLPIFQKRLLALLDPVLDHAPRPSAHLAVDDFAGEYVETASPSVWMACR
jgi:hypothetical protein